MDATLIIYDGDCLFCQSYVRLVRLREAAGIVELINARSGDERVAHYARLGYDLNEGMVLVHRGHIYHGSNAVHVLAGLTSPISVFNRLNSRILASRVATAALYPFLKLVRRLTLLVRGKGMIKLRGLDQGRPTSTAR